MFYPTAGQGKGICCSLGQAGSGPGCVRVKHLVQCLGPPGMGNIRALRITSTILWAPSYSCSIMGPKNPILITKVPTL